MPLKSDLVDEALMCCPLPIADTILMIDSAQNLHYRLGLRGTVSVG
jgi:hypothetical protein